MLDRFEITGKNILITGATSGIGRRICEDFMNSGALVTGLGRNLEALNELQKEYKEFFTPIQIDLNDPVQINEFCANSNTQFNGFVHAAGIIHRRPLKMITEDIWDQTFNVNVKSGFLLVKELYKNKGLLNASSIVFISSVASSYAAIGNISYMSSKGAVNSLVKGLALELAKKQIRVNGIEPGLIKTHLTKQVSDDEIERVTQDYPLGRLGNLEDISNGTLFLISEASNWMTGQFLRLDGGLTLK